MKAEQLNAIKARAEKATPGPWELDTDDNGIWNKGGKNYLGQVTLSTADAKFIAASREDIPQLVAEVERLEEIAIARFHLNKSWGRLADEKEANIQRLKSTITYACEMISIGESGKANDKLTEALGVPYDHFEEESE